MVIGGHQELNNMKLRIFNYIKKVCILNELLFIEIPTADGVSYHEA